MSLILDALNRAREDSGNVPGLSTHHAQGDAPSRHMSLLLGALLVLALGVIAWLVLNRPQPEATNLEVQQSVAVPTSTPSTAEPVSARPQTEPITSTARPAASDTNKEPVSAQPAAVPADEPVVKETAAPDVAALYARAARGSDESASAGKKAAAAAQPRTSQSVAAAPAVKQDVSNLDMAELIKQAENQLENARLSEHAAPFINELSQQSKDRIPTVYYQRHAYSGRAGESRVHLNGKALQVGGSPVSGMRVEEILPDSVVLRYDGIEFRLRALNSWVNL